jgi:predicted amidophosphoribosyltransferase
MVSAGTLLDHARPSHFHPQLSAARCDRRIGADKFAVNSAASVRRVLVLDDVWITVSNARWAALALRRAGAAVVSVLVIAGG